MQKKGGNKKQAGGDHKNTKIVAEFVEKMFSAVKNNKKINLPPELAEFFNDGNDGSSDEGSDESSNESIIFSRHSEYNGNNFFKYG
jgi:hypothetical protein